MEEDVEKTSRIAKYLHSIDAKLAKSTGHQKQQLLSNLKTSARKLVSVVELVMFCCFVHTAYDIVWFHIVFAALFFLF